MNDMKSINIIKYIAERLFRNQDLVITFIGEINARGCEKYEGNKTFCAEFAKVLANYFHSSDIIRYNGVWNDELTEIKSAEGPIVVFGGTRHRDGSVSVIQLGIENDEFPNIIDKTEQLCKPIIKGKQTDIYFILFGINESFISFVEERFSPKEFYEHYKKFCLSLKENDPQAIPIIITPLYDYCDNGEIKAVEPYCDYVRAISEELDIPLIDMHKLWRKTLFIGDEYNKEASYLNGLDDKERYEILLNRNKETANFIFDEMKSIDFITKT